MAAKETHTYTKDKNIRTTKTPFEIEVREGLWYIACGFTGKLLSKGYNIAAGEVGKFNAALEKLVASDINRPKNQRGNRTTVTPNFN